MARIVYCGGEFVAENEAKLSLFDRGFLFGDAVYEVTAVIGGKMVDNDLHLARLERSLSELSIPMPLSREEIEAIQLALIEKNALVEGTVYLQVSRGAEDRDFLYSDGLEPTFIAFTQVKNLLGSKGQKQGLSVNLAEDPRWERRDIKTVMLLGQVMAKRQAKATGFDDTWFFEDGAITEGASSSAFIVTHDRRIITRGNSKAILPGCTRAALLKLCSAHDVVLEERPFTIAEAQGAAEAFQTSATSLVTPIVRIGDVSLNGGVPGPVTRQLQAYYLETVNIPKAAG
ncbi:D-amino-acid transaminase [Rhizobium sp. NTR19]|uniref:Probable branched-chain-amino-acid aminotransferase n=1 Tax=Neorhizobium turbinariae TaxID=2937795 RepID=A0ABT0IPV7_9HYPH|nr:D-amino-acid transaminase [Neorhizobium turbinariae]MCK8779905.1 D-amino-acid transaminase [Neorhizobium turbinariae]